MIKFRKSVLFLFATVLALAATGVWAGEILRTGKKLYSQGSEELVVRDFFNDKKGGFFVDVGCSDYQEYSTTYYLEKNLGWKGIGVDALGEYADDYKKYRPNTRFLNLAVSDKTGGAIDIIVNPLQKSLSTIDPQTAKAFRRSYTQKVPLTTLNDLLKKEKIRRIDFLSMDIEDSEPAALAGFDIRKYRPKLVCVEAHDHIRSQLWDYFMKNGYERLDDYSRLDYQQNWYFKPKEPALIRFFKKLFQKQPAR